MSFQNQLNRYTCTSCEGHIVTIDRDDGTTPFMLRCRATDGCNGMMQSSFYRVPPYAVPTFEWRKPTYTEFRKSSKAMQQHFEMGGLDIHPIKQS